MNILTSRRHFLVGSSAFAVQAFAEPLSGLTPRPKLAFGVLSDIHITDWASTEILRKAFRYFREADVDAVLIAGDLADHGLLPQLENVAKAWFSVFPDDRGRHGQKVERLFIYGNHDPDGLLYRDGPMDKAFKAMHLTYAEAEKLALRNVGLDKAWERCFHEPYAPIYVKNVKGYDFIGAHWDRANGSGWGTGPAIDEWLQTHAARLDTSKPFFYFQHPHPRGTVFAGDSWGEDFGATTRAFAAYPFATVFSGHSHRPITDDRNFWREEFTSIGTGSLSYVSLPSGRKGGKNYRDRLDGRCGQLVRVFGDRLVVERRDFFNDEDLDAAVVLEMPVRTSSFSVRSVRKEARPMFGREARVTAVAEGRAALDFRFSGAFANPTARPFDYTVKIESRVAGKEPWSCWSKSEQWMQPEAALSRRRAQAAGDVRGRIDLSGIPADAEAVRIHVYARNCYGIAYGEIFSDWVPLAKAGQVTK